MKVAKLMHPVCVALGYVKRYIAVHGLPVTANDRKLAALKDRHKGQRCFVIGNGPSLCIEDLNKLRENADVTIASNRIYLAFEESDWRPTYYTVADRLVAENDADQIKKLDLVKVFHGDLKGIFGESTDQDCKGVHLYYRSLKANYDENGNYLSYFSPDALEGFHVGPTVTNINIQLAYYLGCNPIYIIGIDGVFQKIPSTKKQHHAYGEVLVSQGEVNHFHKDYHKPGETWSIPKPEYAEIAYRCCRNFLDAQGVTILNASRRSVVQAFERVDLDLIL